MSVLRIKDAQGNWVGVPSIKGEKGDTGATGPQGPKGDSGTDGISPTVTITPITGGHRITITDADGEHSFDVMDGSGGGGGSDGIFKVNLDESTSTLDKTWQEIYDALLAGQPAVAFSGNAQYEYAGYECLDFAYNNVALSRYELYINGNVDTPSYACSSANGYPSRLSTPEP